MNSIREQEIKRFPPSLVNKTLSFFHIKSTKKEKKKLKKMLDLLPTDSDGETLASSQSSMSNGSSDRCSSLSRLSFDTSTILRSSSSSSSSKALDLSLGPRDFKLIRKIGSGDIGTVYLCKLMEEFPSPSPAMYAMKVVDREVLRRKKKMSRAEIEKTILKLLHHPFLPTLYADFDASPCYSCVVTEFCSGGDLHSLRHRQPAQRFSLNAARFYAAEVLVALEYLHMLGVVYRDLKPENILIRSDGHIMLSDFDLSLLSTSSPSLHLAAAPASPRVVPSCSPLLGPSRRNMKSRPPPVCFVAEPVGARSHSFVGTHEYVAPEVASGQAHGNGVDWWAYGVFVYELLYGRTPFVGPTNDATLKNIVKKPLSFPSATGSGPAELAPARDLIAGLLAKDPAARLGASRGAADVKAHPFFKGVKFALLRSSKPPFVSGLTRAGSCKAESRPKPEPFDYF